MSACRSAAGLSLLLLATGCSLALSRQPVPPPDEGPWSAERHRFTRSTKVYDRFDDVAFATATYQAPSVRAARLERVAIWRGLTEQEREAQRAQEREAEGKFEDFLLSFYTGERAANDLDSPKSVWRVVVDVPGGGELVPERIESVHVDATLTQLYPYIGHFDTVYQLRFPRWAGPRPLAETPFVLRVAGPLGKVELRFDQAPPD